MDGQLHITNFKAWNNNFNDCVNHILKYNYRKEQTGIKTNVQHIKVSGQDHYENGQYFCVTVYLQFYLFGM